VARWVSLVWASRTHGTVGDLLEQTEAALVGRTEANRARPSGSRRLSLAMTKPDEHPRFLSTIPEGCITVSPTEAARMLGVSRSTIHGLISRDELPSLKIGGARKILVAHLEEWIRERIGAEGTKRTAKEARGSGQPLCDQCHGGIEWFRRWRVRA
jgi:excisionase family DNA binding protein